MSSFWPQMEKVLRIVTENKRFPLESFGPAKYHADDFKAAKTWHTQQPST